FYYSLMMAVIILGYFLASFAVKVAIFAIKRTPVLGTQFLHYIHNLSKPLRFVILTFVIRVGFTVIFSNTPLTTNDQYSNVTSRIDALITCLLTTALTFLAKAL